jgi:hypothetical protein
MAHSNVLVTLIICAGIVGSIIIVSKRPPSQIPVEKNLQDIIAITDKTNESDTDNDGLKDWEESLIGTNPSNSDTDGDKTTDGDEISQGRDPKKTGPNDKTNTQNTQQYTAGLSDITLTEQVSKDFFSRYIAVKQQNKDLTQEEAALIAQSVIQNVSVPVTMKLYTITDIKITNDTSTLSKNTYRDALVAALSKNSPKGIESELVLFTRALQTQKESDLLNMDLIIAGYKNIIKDTLQVSVPKNAIADHLIYLNALSAIYDDITYMRFILSDPIKAYSGFYNYQKDVLKLKISIENLETYFTQ